MNSKDYIANYELNRYQYSEFWKDRGYEHKAEDLRIRSLLSLYLSDLSTRNIIDIGGAFGRLTYLYSEAKNIVLMDYSTNELQEGVSHIKDLPYKEKVTFLAANAYKIPVKDGAFGAILCVRVMHHLKETSLFFAEVSRILAPGGVAIIEFANKNHILSLFRNWLRGNRGFAKQAVSAVSHNSATSQGIAHGQESIMYNFSPQYVVETAISAGLTVKGSYSCSFLRIAALKKIFPESLLVRIESIFQKIAAHLLLTPSVFVVLQKNGQYQALSNQQMYQCPDCGAVLTIKDTVWKCSERHTFDQKNLDIVDLRSPRPEQVTF